MKRNRQSGIRLALAMAGAATIGGCASWAEQEITTPRQAIRAACVHEHLISPQRRCQYDLAQLFDDQWRVWKDEPPSDPPMLDDGPTYAVVAKKDGRFLGYVF